MASHTGRSIAEVSLDFGDQSTRLKTIAGETGQTFDQVKAKITASMTANGLTFDKAAGLAEADFDRLKSSAFTSYNAVSEAANDGLSSAAAVTQEWSGKIAGMLPDELTKRYHDIRTAGYQSMVEHAKGLIEGQNEPKVAFDAMVQIENESMDRGTEIARLKGQLTSHSLASGLRSGIPADRLAAEAAREAINARLDLLGVDARTWGANAGKGLAVGLDSKYGVVRDSAGHLAAAVKGQIGILSEPKDPSSPLRGITQWGGNISKTLAAGMVGDLGALQAASSMAARAAVPQIGAITGPDSMSAGSMASAGSSGYAGAAPITLIFNSSFPPTPTQGQALARAILPELTREQRRQGL